MTNNCQFNGTRQSCRNITIFGKFDILKISTYVYDLGEVKDGLPLVDVNVTCTKKPGL